MKEREVLILTRGLWLNYEYADQDKQPQYEPCLTTGNISDLGVDFTEGGRPENMEKNPPRTRKNL